jgi:mannose-6-phosphate isomerase-like protein (cupin superfamily)
MSAIYSKSSWVGCPPFIEGEGMLTERIALIIIVTASGNVFAYASSTTPEIKSPAAITVRSAEVSAVVRKNSCGPVADSVLRVVSIESQYNVGLSVVCRSKVNGKTPPDAVVHESITEVYQIIEGRGVLVTGGTIESASPLPADDPDVRRLIGPSSIGRLILEGTRQDVGPGDVVVIPPHTPHGFVELKTERIVYTLIRIDPQRLLELKGQPR